MCSIFVFFLILVFKELIYVLIYNFIKINKFYVIFYYFISIVLIELDIIYVYIKNKNIIR